MAKSLRILILEDNPIDAELVQFELHEADITFTSKVVMKEEDFIRELQEFTPDLILSDYDLPTYNGALALAEAKKRCPDTPFILVTGAVGEDRAIEILTQGAKDYVLKSRLQQRLVPAVRRALAETEERQRAQEAIQKAHDELEIRVRERTAELEQANKALQAEISERRRVEEYIKQSENKFATAFLKNSIPAAITTVKEGRFIEVSESFLKLLGLTQNEVIGNTSTGTGFITPEQRTIVLNEFKQKGSVVNLELQIRTKGGERRYGLFNSVKISILNKDHLLTVVTDITDRKRVEEEILILANLSDISPLSITVHDLEGNFLYANQKTFDMHGYSKEEFLARNLSEIDMPSSAVLIEERIKEILETGEGRFNTEHYRKNGTFFPLEVYVKTAKWKGKTVMLSVAADITGRKRAEEELKKYREGLEVLVSERTRELEGRTKDLQEVNTALNVLLKKREEDKKILEDSFITNIRSLILPYVKMIKNNNLDAQQNFCLDIVEKNLGEIASPLLKTIQQFDLTPREIQVASLIKDGKKTNEIARTLGIGKGSIDTHRKNIRKKLGLGRMSNLQSHLHFLRK